MLKSDINYRKYFIVVLIFVLAYNVISITTTLILMLCLKNPFYLYSALFFCPFSLLFIYLNFLKTKTLAIRSYQKNKFKNFMYYTIMFFHVVVIVIPLLVLLLTYQAFLELYSTLIITILFVAYRDFVYIIGMKMSRVEQKDLVDD